MLIGHRLTEVDSGFAEFQLEPGEYHYNPFASVHGGIASTLLDSAMSAAVLSTLPIGRSCSTIEMKVNFVRQVNSRTGLLRCEGKIIYVGNRIATTEGKVIDPKGHYQTLFAQLFFSLPLLVICSLVLEWNAAIYLDGVVVSALAYQTLVVAFFSYVLWFWMIHRFPVSRLAAFTFLPPLFGVILSGLLLDKPLPFWLWIGLTLVASGIYLVNRPYNERSKAEEQSSRGIE